MASTNVPRLPAYSVTASHDEDESHMRQLLGALDELNLGNHSDAQLHTCLPTPTTPSLSPVRPREEEERVYHFQTPIESGFTDRWDLAAAKTQGVPGSSPQRLTPKRNPRRKKGGYAVFVGKVPGPYRDWDDVVSLVTGVPCNIHRSYGTYEKATAAYEYAKARSWTRSSYSTFTAPSSSIPRLPTPNVLDPLNPLHDNEDDSLWYVVYSGIAPGVYQSSLEYSLNVVGVRGAVHDSAPSRELAEQRFQDALADDRLAMYALFLSLYVSPPSLFF
ncbi:hypothetical protein C8R47DRAFT_1228444 [Mycena vitilis]|nr:hypothetical protein C8R47DRAFT_1228444 [Mycena vitilis]